MYNITDDLAPRAPPRKDEEKSSSLEHLEESLEDFLLASSVVTEEVLPRNNNCYEK